MPLVEISLEEIEAIAAGTPLDRPVAPGWPHDGTAAGFSFARSGGTQFLILDDDGRVAGDCGTKAPPTPDGVVEIGYGLAAPSRGKGLGTRAVAELVAWLFERGSVSIIEAEVHDSNQPSRRIVERLDFVPEPTTSDGYRRYRLSRTGQEG